MSTMGFVMGFVFSSRARAPTTLVITMSAGSCCSCSSPSQRHAEDARRHAQGGEDSAPEGRVQERNVVGIVTRGGGKT